MNESYMKMKNGTLEAIFRPSAFFVRFFLFSLTILTYACRNRPNTTVATSVDLEQPVHLPDSIVRDITGVRLSYSIDTLKVFRTLKTIKEPPVIKDYPFSAVNTYKANLAIEPRTLDMKIANYDSQKKVPKFGMQIVQKDTIYGPEKMDMIWPKSIDNITMTARENSNASIDYLSPEIYDSGGQFLRGVSMDSRGHLWISEVEEGVSRFDGHSITRFTTENGLKGNFVHVTYEDRQNNLWFGLHHSGGLTRYDGEFLLHFNAIDDLNVESINSIFQDENNIYWIGTDDGLILLEEHQDNWSYQVLKTEEGLPNSYINSIHSDAAGTIWIATNSGLVSYNQGKFIHHDIGHVMDMDQSKDGGFWIASYVNGLMKYEEGTFFNYTFQGDHKFRNLLSIFVDEKDGVWFGSAWEGLGYLDEENITLISENEGLKGSMIWDITSDGQGNLWLATYDGGLNRFNTSSFKFWGADDNLTESLITGLIKDSAGKKYITSYQGGLTTFYNNEVQIYKGEFSIGDDKLIASLMDSNQNLWLAGIDSPIIKYKDGISEVFSLITKDGKRLVISYIHEDSEGNIWMGTNTDSIVKYDGENFLFLDFGDHIKERWIKNVTSDEQGGIWFWRHNGIVRYINNQCYLFNNPDKIEMFDFFIEVTEGNTVWFEGDGYLGIIAPNTLSDAKLDKISYYGNSDLLFGGTPMDIISDEKGMQWITTHNGLIRLTRIEEEGTTGYRSTNIGRKHDLFNSTNSNSLVLDEGKLWMGGSQEFGYKDISKYMPEKDIPQIRLHTIEVDEKYIQYNKLNDNTYANATGLGSVLSETVEHIVPFSNLPESLVVPYYMDHLTFRFSAVDWSRPTNVEYQYMIEGLDDQWSESTNKEFADYRNIPFGKYTFLARAKGKSGIWTEPLSYAFIVKPPWWHTWWAYAIYMMLAIAAIYAFAQWRVAKVRREVERQAKFKSTVNTLEMRALRAQMNPHFIFNTLNSIQSAMILESERAANQIMSAFSKLLRVTLNMSRSEYISLEDEVAYITAYLKLEEGRFNGSLETNIEAEANIDMQHTMIPCMMFQPIVENALFHGLQPKKGNKKLDIRIEQRGSFIIGTVIDNGVGRAAAETNKQVRGITYKSVASQIMNERIEINNTVLDAKMGYKVIDLYENDRPKGTKVILTIPIWNGSPTST